MLDQRVGDLAVLHLEVRDGRAQPGVPVDHVAVAVDVALLVQVHEDPLDRGHIALVHGEALAPVVEGGAQPLQLIDDLPAVPLLPLPHPAHELLAPDLGARDALGGQRLLDHRLGGDAGVIGAADPERLVAGHAPRADQQVLDRVVEGVPHVERARHVRRRDRDREGRAIALGIGVPHPRLVPGPGPAGLDLGRVEAVRRARLGRHRPRPGRAHGVLRRIPHRPRPPCRALR